MTTSKTPSQIAAKDLESKLESKTATVGIIGLGYVGLPLAHAMHGAGLNTLGFDVDQKKVDALNSDENYLAHLGDQMMTDLSESPPWKLTASGQIPRWASDSLLASVHDFIESKGS